MLPTPIELFKRAGAIHAAAAQCTDLRPSSPWSSPGSVLQRVLREVLMPCHRLTWTPWGPLPGQPTGQVVSLCGVKAIVLPTQSWLQTSLQPLGSTCCEKPRQSSLQPCPCLYPCPLSPAILHFPLTVYPCLHFWRGVCVLGCGVTFFFCFCFLN